MADEIKRKRVTLHPLKKDGTLDLYTNLYPKCLNTGIVDENGNEVSVLTSEGSETFDQAIARLQAEIDEKGGVTEEELQEAIANVETDISGKQDVIADLDDIRTGAAAGAAAVSQDDFNNTMGEVEDRFNELNDVIVPYCFINFTYDEKDARPMLTGWTEGLLTSGDRQILLEVNGNLAEVWHISSWTSNNRITIELYNEISYIEIHGNVNTEPDQWELDLSSYFAPLSSDIDFYPSITIIDEEKTRDNVLEVNWVTDFRNRLETLMSVSVPAKLYTSKNDMGGEPVTIYATHDEESPDGFIIVHIRTSNGEYKLFYTYEEDPL